MQAERALYSARLDLQQRNRSLNLARGSAQREADSAASQSLLSRLTSSSPAAAHLKSLEVEVSAMEAVERQMVKDVATLKRRKMMRELGRSWKGRLWLLVGWLFSLYCVWRVFVVSTFSLLPTCGHRLNRSLLYSTVRYQPHLWLLSTKSSVCESDG